MKKDKLQDLVLSELQELKKEIKEIRQTDIPNLKIDIAIEKERTSKTARIITGVGGIISIAVSAAIAKWSK